MPSVRTATVHIKQILIIAMLRESRFLRTALARRSMGWLQTSSGSLRPLAFHNGTRTALKRKRMREENRAT